MSPCAGNSSGSDFLFGNHRDAGRSSGERCKDDQLGSAIGIRNGRSVALCFHFEATPNDAEDRLASLQGGLGKLV